MKRIFNIFSLAMTLALVVTSLGVTSASATSTTYELQVSGTYNYLSSDPAMDIATGLTATSNPAGGTINGARVVIGTGFQAGDVLSATDSGGVVSSYNSSNGVLTLTGTANVSVYQTVLGSVQFSTTSTNAGARTITYSLGQAVPFDGNGHFYIYVSSPLITWTDAKTAAEASSYYGLTGYLATITGSNDNENAFATNKLDGQGAWLGGSDAAVEGEWRWVTGPEAGTLFCTDTVPGQGGCTDGGQYDNWADTQPDNYWLDGSPEHYLQFQAGQNGKWNDLPNTGFDNSWIQGYVVEYGGMVSDSPMDISGSVTVNVVDTTEPVATIDVYPSNPDSNTTPTFEFSGTDNVSDPANLTFGCAIDFGSYFSCTSPYTVDPALSAGEHTFSVYATDEAGNYQVIDTTYTWTIEAAPVDTTAPVVTINSGPASPTNKLSATFTFSGTDNVTAPANLTYECGIDTGFWLPCSSPKSYTGLTEGAHQFWVRAQDEAGNYSTPVSHLWSIVPTTITYTSVGTQDGWVLESTETSNVGGTFNATGSSFNLGDDKANKQYKGILSFNTAPLPDNAVIKSTVIKIKQFGSPSGTNPFSILGGLLVDIRKGFFGTSALQASDFQAAPSAAKVSTINKVPQAGWYSGVISATGRNNILKTGTTQFRLYFTKDDDNNKIDADYMMFVSGNPTSSKPQLIISYFVP